MAKESKISWNDKQKKLLQDTVKKFNQKRNRIAKDVNKWKEWEFLPNKISVRELKKQIYSARDLKIITNKYQRFLKPGAENYNEKRGTLNWVYNEAVISRRARNQKIKNMQEKFELNPLKGRSGLGAQANILMNQQDLSKMNHNQLKRLTEVNQNYMTTKGQYDRLNQYRSNFKQAIDNQLGFLKESRRLKGRINQLDERELEWLYYNSTYINIGYVYPPEGEEANYLNAIMNELEWYLQKDDKGKTRLQKEMGS